MTIEQNFFSLDLMINSMPHYVYWKNKKSIYMACNDNTARLLGLKNKEEICGKRDKDFYWLEESLTDEFAADDLRVMIEKITLTKEYRVSIKQFGREPRFFHTDKLPLYDQQNQVIGVLGIARDITEQKFVEKEIHVSSMLLEDIIFNLPGLIYWKNKQHQYVGFNKNVVELSGLSRTSLYGKTDLEINWGKKEAKVFQEEDKEVMETGVIKITESALPLKRADGSYIVVRTEKNRLYDRDGHIVGMLGVALDITDKKIFEQKLIIAKEKAEFANKAKTEFIMNMSHDLRTPLVGIIGLASIQADGKMQQQEQQQYGAWIHSASEQLLELLNSVIEVTAAEHPIESIKKQTVNLIQLGKELQTLIQPSLQSKGLSFQVKMDPTLPAIISDRIKLKRLLLNLLSNAVKFTPQGEICLAINLLAIERDQAKIEIQISDTGIGIAKDRLDKIFDRFYRVHPSYQGEYTGYGIGLYLVKKTVEQLNGEIKVASEEGKGSCFTLGFNFSLAEEDQDENKTTLQESERGTYSESRKLKGTVLVAEDNTLVLHAVKNILSYLDYEVITVTKGKAALQALQTQSFIWALLDIGLPDLAGTEVAQRYRQWEQANNKLHLPLFVLTAHAIEEVQEKCSEIGIDYVFHKPFTGKDIQTVEQLIQQGSII
jgi:PAS domain S-box-containing protein